PALSGPGCAIAGICDVAPLRLAFPSEKRMLAGAWRRRTSPMIRGGGPARPLSLVVGSAELPLLRKQTADFAGHRARYGLPVTYEEIPGADHFTIMNQMLAPQGRITTLIRQLFEWG
ncbi:alpha/beta hydrolase, partial [Bradyrhizobium sp. UFLA 03-164]|nr:alpha/beta hydrolase [Bradyrhizobium uaiense]